jgi:hypothetical protein
MKRSKIILIISFLLLFSFITSVDAAVKKYNFSKDSGVAGMASGAGFSAAVAPESYIGIGLSILFSVLGIIFLVLTIYAGIKWMTAQGNTSQVDQAKDTLTRAIIGLVISISAYAITYFILKQAIVSMAFTNAA